MKPKIILYLSLVLSGGLLGCSTKDSAKLASLHPSGSKPIYAHGQVIHPGTYPFRDNLTLAALIADAGGLTTYCNRVVVRHLDGSWQKVSASQINSSEILLKSGDDVYAFPVDL